MCTNVHYDNSNKIFRAKVNYYYLSYMHMCA